MKESLGLSEKEAAKSREKHGINVISKKKKHTFINLFIESLGDPIIRILLIALAIKILFLISEFDWYETIGIAIAIFLASFISTVSEYGSEAAFKKLQEEASKISCKVYRDGILKALFIDEVVVNDVVLLQSGDKIPADGILISGTINVDESALNGESKEVSKNLKNNKLFKGTIVCSNEAKMKVISVGDNTLFGNIASELQEDKRDSPLKLRLNVLAKTISRLGYIGAILVSLSYLFNVIFIQNNIGILSNSRELFGHILHAVTLAVTVIVVAVPEGLPMMITLVLSSNMKKMLKDNVLVRKLVGIETSGNINILFTDKTGTLTKGKLTVNTFINGESKEYKLSVLSNKQELFKMLKLSLLYNNASTMDEKHTLSIGSNATDRALLEYISKYDNDFLNVKKETIISFNSSNKISITKVMGDYNLSLIKGAPEKILPNCKYYYDDEGNKKLLFSKTSLINKIENISKLSVRFIAVATFDYNKDVLTLVGLIGIKDDVRKEVRNALEVAKKALIQVVMITGDSKDTAVAVANEVGLIENNSLVLTSDDLKTIDDEKLKKFLPSVRVIARALPSDKSRLVRISQEMGLVVGMTGDGVNDAPALKKADVGIAMGSGTEVAKEASDIVIIDDNFTSITKAILYGRTIFKNIRKFIIFQLTVNFCAVGLSIIGPFIGINTPITVIQMLWVNMVMDTLAALAFAGEAPLKEYMEEEPKKRDELIINYYMKDQIFVTGIYSLLLCILFLKLPIMKDIFGAGNNLYLMTSFFALFIFIGIFNSFNARTHRLNLLSHIIRNKGFIAIMLLVAVIQMFIIYYGGSLFRTMGIDIKGLWLIIILSFSVIPMDLFRKTYLRLHGNKGGV